MDKLYYYSKSANKPVGKGVNEYIKDISKYKKLSEIKDWRKILSNFHKYTFTYKNKKYNSTEHAFQARKIHIANPELAKNFESDSKSDIGKGDGLVARRARKLIILNKEQIKKWDEIKDEIMLNIWRAKYSQCDIAKEVLLATNNAELWHGMPRSKPIRQINLELVREELFQSSKIISKLV